MGAMDSLLSGAEVPEAGQQRTPSTVAGAPGRELGVNPRLYRVPMCSEHPWDFYLYLL